MSTAITNHLNENNSIDDFKHDLLNEINSVFGLLQLLELSCPNSREVKICLKQTQVLIDMVQNRTIKKSDKSSKHKHYKVQKRSKSCKT